MKLDNFDPMPIEAVKAVFDLAGLQPGESHIELGSGDGRLVVEALARGADSVGYEIDKTLARDSRKEHGITVVGKDCFDVDISQADVITCWFTKLPETRSLMKKLFSEMKPSARLVKGGFTPSHWDTTKGIERISKWDTQENELFNDYPVEIFQGQKIIRVAGVILCLYIK